MNRLAIKRTEDLGALPQQRKRNLIVVDDDIGMQSLLSDVLSSLGYSVMSCSDAVGALKMLAIGNQKIDAVICDLNMPKLSGMDFLDVLAKMNLKVPVILITAFGTSRLEQIAKTKGAFGYLSKPFQLSEVSRLIEQATVG